MADEEVIVKGFRLKPEENAKLAELIQCAACRVHQGALFSEVHGVRPQLRLQIVKL